MHRDEAIISQEIAYRDGLPFIAKRTKANGDTNHHDSKERFDTVNKGKHNPCSILPIKGDNKLENGLHPTQKPVELMEYLIKTYTNEGETVLDFTAGSFTTGVACVNLNRKFIGIELDKDYFDIGVNRILKAQEP